MALALVGSAATGIDTTDTAGEPSAGTTQAANAKTASAGSVMLAVTSFGDAANVSTVTCTDDNSPPNWVAVASVLHAVSDHQLEACFSKTNTNAGSTTVTATVSVAAGWKRIALIEISGALLAAPLGTPVSTEAGTTATGAGANTLSPITPSQVGNWIVSMWNECGGGLFSAPAGWTLDAAVQPTIGAGAQIVMMHQQAASLSPITPAATCDTAGDTFHGIAVEVIQAGGGPGNAYPFTILGRGAC